MKNPQELEKIFIDLGLAKFRAKQLLHAVFKEGKDDVNQITTFSASDREKISKNYKLLSIESVRVMKSKDGMTTKCLFKTSDDKFIESVLMRFRDGRNSVCVSSQVGCQLGCKFCATGTLKFGRNLSYEEITDQVLFFHMLLMKENQHVTNIVYMGMGEPFMNYENVMASLMFLNHKDAFNIGARNITVSTAGVCEGIRKFADEPYQFNLAISLHAPTQEVREKIMPIAKKYKLEELMEALNYYIQKTNRRISYEYVMLKNINDQPEHARALAELVKDQLCHVNLIPYNATGIINIEGAERNTITHFRDIVESYGVAITIRVTIGQDIDAACGQLANKAKNNN